MNDCYFSWEYHFYSASPCVYILQCCLESDPLLVVMESFSTDIKINCINLVLEDDDVAVLDLISRTGGDLMQGRGVSGSVAREPSVESYTRDGMFT